MEITPTERKRIVSWGSRLTSGITLRYATTGHLMDAAFKAFGDLMVDLVPGVSVRKDSDAAVALPTVFAGDRIAYQALPLDRELDLFLSVLADGDAFSDRIDGDVRRRLSDLNTPALIKVYISPFCPHCPITVSTLLGLAACSDWVRLTVIDGGLFADSAEKDRISAAPTVILDNRFRWTGSVDAKELVTLMMDRDPADLSADALRGMIEAGDAQGVAEMMIERGKLFDGFTQLLIHPRWSVRLGAMVAFESLTELDPTLAGNVVYPLKRHFDEVGDAVKGDLLHVVGESGNRAALPFLETVAAAAEDDEVRDAADEAIQKLKSFPTP